MRPTGSSLQEEPEITPRQPLEEGEGEGQGAESGNSTEPCHNYRGLSGMKGWPTERLCTHCQGGGV